MVFIFFYFFACDTIRYIGDLRFWERGRIVFLLLLRFSYSRYSFVFVLICPHHVWLPCFRFPLAVFCSFGLSTAINNSTHISFTHKRWQLEPIRWKRKLWDANGRTVLPQRARVFWMSPFQTHTTMKHTHFIKHSFYRLRFLHGSNGIIVHRRRRCC